MFAHILFDLDDTLFDFQQSQKNGIILLCKKYHIPFTDDLYKLYVDINHCLWKKFNDGLISKDYVQNKRFELFFDCLHMKVEGKDVNNQYQHFLVEHTFLIPFADTVCAELSKKHTLSIITNGVGKTQHQRINNSPISHYFKNVFVSEEVGYAKPNRAFFDYILKKISCINKQEVLIVGDSLESDILGANNIGVPCCFFNPQKKEIVSSCHIDFIINDLQQLISIIENS